MFEMLLVCAIALICKKLEDSFSGYLKDCNQPLSERTTPLSRY
jgi:hypothetical protein